MNIYIISWFVIGFITFIIAAYIDYKNGIDFRLGDVIGVILFAGLGPIATLIYVIAFSYFHYETIIIKGKGGDKHIDEWNKKVGEA